MPRYKNGINKGFGFIEYADNKSCESAIKRYNNLIP